MEVFPPDRPVCQMDPVHWAVGESLGGGKGCGEVWMLRLIDLVYCSILIKDFGGEDYFWITFVGYQGTSTLILVGVAIQIWVPRQVSRILRCAPPMSHLSDQG